jgi:hypothetical protein
MKGDSLMAEFLRLVVRHPVPSVNRLFAMNPWQRRREKQATQAAFAPCGMTAGGSQLGVAP